MIMVIMLVIIRKLIKADIFIEKVIRKILLVIMMANVVLTKMKSCTEFVWMLLYNKLFLGSHQRWKVIEG